MWSTKYDGTANRGDSVVDLALDEQSKVVYVTGWSHGRKADGATVKDWVTLSLSATTGEIRWLRREDFASGGEPVAESNTELAEHRLSSHFALIVRH